MFPQTLILRNSDESHNTFLFFSQYTFQFFRLDDNTNALDVEWVHEPVKAKNFMTFRAWWRAEAGAYCAFKISMRIFHPLGLELMSESFMFDLVSTM